MCVQHLLRSPGYRSAPTARCAQAFAICSVILAENGLFGCELLSSSSIQSAHALQRNSGRLTPNKEAFYRTKYLSC